MESDRAGSEDTGRHHCLCGSVKGQRGQHGNAAWPGRGLSNR